MAAWATPLSAGLRLHHGRRWSPLEADLLVRMAQQLHRPRPVAGRGHVICRRTALGWAARSGETGPLPCSRRTGCSGAAAGTTESASITNNGSTRPDPAPVNTICVPSVSSNSPTSCVPSASSSTGDGESRPCAQAGAGSRGPGKGRAGSALCDSPSWGRPWHAAAPREAHPELQRRAGDRQRRALQLEHHVHALLVCGAGRMSARAGVIIMRRWGAGWRRTRVVGRRHCERSRQTAISANRDRCPGARTSGSWSR